MKIVRTNARLLFAIVAFAVAVLTAIPTVGRAQDQGCLDQSVSCNAESDGMPPGDRGFCALDGSDCGCADPNNFSFYIDGNICHACFPFCEQ